MRNISVAMLLLFICTAGALGASKPLHPKGCSLLTTPWRFHGKTIAVRADLSRNYEFTVLKIPGCGGAVNLEYPDADRSKVVQDDNWERFEAANATLKCDATIDPPLFGEFLYDVTATFVGRFESAKVLRNGRVITRRGFGHLGQFPARLVLRRVFDVQAFPAEVSGCPERQPSALMPPTIVFSLAPLPRFTDTAPKLQ